MSNKYTQEQVDIILACLGRATAAECYEKLCNHSLDFRRNVHAIEQKAVNLRSSGLTKEYFKKSKTKRGSTKDVDRAKYPAPQDDTFLIRFTKLKDNGLAKSKMENGARVFYSPKTKKTLNHADLHRLWVGLRN